MCCINGILLFFEVLVFLPSIPSDPLLLEMTVKDIQSQLADALTQITFISGLISRPSRDASLSDARSPVSVLIS